MWWLLVFGKPRLITSKRGSISGRIHPGKTMKKVMLSFLLIGAWCFSAFASFVVEANAEAPTIAVTQKSKRLAVYLDGTWNAVDTNTNVWRMKALTAKTGNDGPVRSAPVSLQVRNGLKAEVAGKMTH
jgi:hypothetical protein